MLYLEAEIKSVGLGAATQLDSGSAAGVLAYLEDKYLIADPSQASSGAAQYYIAVPASQAGDVTGRKTASDEIKAMTPGLIALVRDDETAAILKNQPIEGLHIVVTTSQWLSSYPGSSVLWPLTATPEAPKKSMTLPVTLAVVGAGAGGLVGGGLGLVVGGVAGFLVGNAMA